jgi:CubicO group peptidase (beta-lactamase class C family)
MIKQLIVFFTLSAVCYPTFVQAQNLYFPPISSNNWDTLAPNRLGWCSDRLDSLDAFLEGNGTKAFIYLKDGKIVLERYYAGHNINSNWYWASAGKTLTAFLTGIAAQEGKLKLSDSTSAFLGNGWTDCSPEDEARISIWHQLTMTSGLDDGVPDPYCTLDTCLNCLAEPGTRWAYHNGPYTLLDPVLEAATGITLNQWCNNKLKVFTGMTGSFLPSGYNNVFFSNARSMARFGLLLLNRGTWNQTEILRDTAYFRQMTNSSQNLNEAYGYLTWLNGKRTFMVPGSQLRFNGSFFPDAPADAFAALGRDGQFVNVIPSQNAVWIRMGNTPQSTLVPVQLNNEIWKRINQLPCFGQHATIPESVQLRMFPNPATNELHISLPEKDNELCIYDVAGKRVVGPMRFSEEHVSLGISEIPQGWYVAEVKGKRSSYRASFIKE